MTYVSAQRTAISEGLATDTMYGWAQRHQPIHASTAEPCRTGSWHTCCTASSRFCTLATTRPCQGPEPVGGAGTCQGTESMGARQDLCSPDHACRAFLVSYQTRMPEWWGIQWLRRGSPSWPWLRKRWVPVQRELQPVQRHGQEQDDLLQVSEQEP